MGHYCILACKIIRGYLGVFENRTANDYDNSELTGHCWASEDRCP